MNFEFPDRLIPIYFAQAIQKNMSFDNYTQYLLQQITDKISHQHNFKINLDSKNKLSKWIIKRAINLHGTEQLCIAWTGGKDSTIVLWLLRQVCKELKVRIPQVVFINEGFLFPQVEKFVNQIAKKWKLKIQKIANDDVLKYVAKPGDKIQVNKLAQ